MAEEMMNHEEVEHHDDVHHEESDINVRAVFVGVAITAAFFVAMVYGLWAMYVGFRAMGREADPDLPTLVEEPAAVATGSPEFTTHWSEPAMYLEAIREEDRAILEEYGWTDRSAGLVHVPIEVGMEMALDRGYPTSESADSLVGAEDNPVDLTEGTMRSEGGAERDAGEGSQP